MRGGGILFFVAFLALVQLGKAEKVYTMRDVFQAAGYKDLHDYAQSSEDDDAKEARLDHAMELLQLQAVDAKSSWFGIGGNSVPQIRQQVKEEIRLARESPATSSTCSNTKVAAEFAHLALWSYDDPPEKIPLHTNTRFTVEGRPMNLFYDTSYGTIAYKGASPHFDIFVNDPSKTLIVMFRGTDNLEDWVNNLRFKNVPFYTKADSGMQQCGSVHEGFRLEYDAVKPELFSRMLQAKWVERGYKIFVVGHSLGAGMGSMFTIDLAQQFRVPVGRIQPYFFGIPGVGDESFAKCFYAAAPTAVRWVSVYMGKSCFGEVEAEDMMNRVFSQKYNPGAVCRIKCPRSCNTRCCDALALVPSLKCHQLTNYIQGLQDGIVLPFRRTSK